VGAAVDSAPAEAGRPLLPKGREAFQPVLGPEHLLVLALLESKRLVQTQGQPFVDGVLGSRDGQRGIGAHQFRQPMGDFEKPSLGRKSLDQPDGECLGGVDATAGQNEVLRAGWPHQPGQPLGASSSGDDAELHLREPEFRSRGCHTEVARQRELRSTAESGTIDGGDEDAVASFHGAQCPSQLGEKGAHLRLRHPGALLEVRSGAKGALASPGEDDGSGRMAAAHPVHPLLELRECSPTDGVAALLAVDGPHLGTAAALLAELGHDPPLLRVGQPLVDCLARMRSLRPVVLSLLMALGGLAHARVGGGQHYAGPSRSSPSPAPGHSASTSRAPSGPPRSSGSWSGTSSPGPYYPSAGMSPAPLVFDPVLVLSLAVLAIVVLVLVRRLFGASAVTQRALAEQEAVARLDISEADRQAWVSALQRRDPGFATGPFLERVQALFLATQQAWSNGDLTPVRRFLSDATWLRFRVQLALLRAQAIRNVTSDVEVTDLELLGFEQNDWFDTLHVAVHARARDVEVPTDLPEAKALAAAAGAALQPFIEVWSLVRKPGVLSRANGALEARTCPSCGAPFDGGAASTCTYCKAVVNSGAYDWVLAEITQAVEVRRADEAVPGLQKLRERDPALSLEVLEDRASLVFWRWVEAQSTGQPERLARLAGTGPVERLRTDVERLAQKGSRRVFLDCAVGSVQVRAFEEAAGRTLAHVEIRWSSRTGVGPEGEAPPTLPVLPQRWVFTLERAPDAPSRADQGMSTDRCPQCGGPLGDGLEPRCQWCSTLLVGDARDWILAEACPVEAWEGRAGLALEVACPLPDVEERERLLYTLAAMAMADGVVDARERRLLAEFAGRWGLPASRVDEALSAGPASLDVLIPGTHAGEPLLRTLAQLARADGKVDASERRMLEAVAARLGLAQRLPAVLASVGAN